MFGLGVAIITAVSHLPPAQPVGRAEVIIFQHIQVAQTAPLAVSVSGPPGSRTTQAAESGPESVRSAMRPSAPSIPHACLSTVGAISGSTSPHDPAPPCVRWASVCSRPPPGIHCPRQAVSANDSFPPGLPGLPMRPGLDSGRPVPDIVSAHPHPWVGPGSVLGSQDPACSRESLATAPAISNLPYGTRQTGHRQASVFNAEALNRS